MKLAFAAPLCALLALVPPAHVATPVDELLAADRAFAAAATGKDLVSAISAMFADSVVMPQPNGILVDGAEKVTAALRAGPDNLTSKVEWAPIRAGVSADGLQGFTFGYMTQRKADGTEVPAKYMAYWVKEARGWRVLAYKRARRPAGDVSLAMMPPAVPSRTVAPLTNGKAIVELRAGLMQAEKSFSDESQQIGLGAAFAKYGSPDAVNIGGSASYTVGADSIGKAVGGGATGGSPVFWKADKAFVATSGDLGVTFGVIRPNATPNVAGSSFFTIWRRASPTAPWRYVAE